MCGTGVRCFGRPSCRWRLCSRPPRLRLLPRTVSILKNPFSPLLAVPGCLVVPSVQTYVNFEWSAYAQDKRLTWSFHKTITLDHTTHSFVQCDIGAMWKHTDFTKKIQISVFALCVWLGRMCNFGVSERAQPLELNRTRLDTSLQSSFLLVFIDHKQTFCVLDGVIDKLASWSGLEWQLMLFGYVWLLCFTHNNISASLQIAAGGLT